MGHATACPASLSRIYFRGEEELMKIPGRKQHPTPDMTPLQRSRTVNMLNRFQVTITDEIDGDGYWVTCWRAEGKLTPVIGTSEPYEKAQYCRDYVEALRRADDLAMRLGAIYVANFHRRSTVILFSLDSEDDE